MMREVTETVDTQVRAPRTASIHLTTMLLCRRHYARARVLALASCGGSRAPTASAKRAFCFTKTLVPGFLVEVPFAVRGVFADEDANK
jgi:hypothetical protein